MHLRIAQVQKAVLEPHVLAGLGGVLNVKGKIGVRLAQNLQRVHHNFQRTGGDLRVDGFLVPLDHLAVDADHRFPVDILQKAIVMDDHLGHTVLVAQVHKGYAAMVADGIHPAGQTHLFV